MKRKLLTLATAIATVFATTIATSACYWYFYQPKEPKCLEDK
ncbi:MAG: cyclic lactone autoinducer peptide [Anaerocolumna sp.]